MEIIAQLGSILGLSFISGINLYATLAVTGLCTRYGLIEGLPPEFQVLGNDLVILVAVALYGLEFFMDKIPGLDTLWDSLHTFIRPLGGAMLALIQVGEATPVMEVVVFMLGASMASVAHVAKAGTRLIINTSPEPFSNILVSLLEDVGAIGFVYLTMAHPVAAFFITLLCLFLIFCCMPLIFRTIRMLFGAIWFRIRCLFVREMAWTTSRHLPYALDRVFDQVREKDERILWAGRAHAVRVTGIPKFSAIHVVVTNRGVHFLFKRWFRIQRQFLPVHDIEQHKRYPGFLLGKWLLRTSRGDLLLYVYQPLFKALPFNLTGANELEEAMY